MDERTRKEACLKNEVKALKRLAELEDLSEKKIRIFSRLLMDATIAKEMEALANRHAARKNKICVLLGEEQGDEQ